MEQMYQVQSFIDFFSMGTLLFRRVAQFAINIEKYIWLQFLQFRNHINIAKKIFWKVYEQSENRSSKLVETPSIISSRENDIAEVYFGLSSLVKLFKHDRHIKAVFSSKWKIYSQSFYGNS